MLNKDERKKDYFGKVLLQNNIARRRKARVENTAIVASQNGRKHKRLWVDAYCEPCEHIEHSHHQPSFYLILIFFPHFCSLEERWVGFFMHGKKLERKKWNEMSKSIYKWIVIYTRGCDFIAKQETKFLRRQKWKKSAIEKVLQQWYGSSKYPCCDTLSSACHTENYISW